MPLYRSRSFWLEIICALLLALAVANPVGCWSSTGAHSVLVVDSSASMQAAQEWLALQRHLLNSIRQSNKRDVYTVVLAGSTPTVLVGPAAQQSEAIKAIQDLNPSDSRSDMDSALELATTFTTGKVSVYTDQIRADIPEDISWYSVAQPVNNVGFIKATRDGNRIRVSIWNASDVPFNGQLNLYDEQQKIETEGLRLDPDEIVHFTLSSHSSLVQLNIESDTPDPFPLDDQVILLPSENRQLDIAIDMDERTAKMLGLKGLESKQAPLLRLTDGLRLRSSLDAHILITDRNMGGSPTTWRVSFHDSTLKPVTTQQGLFINQRHPLLQDVRLNTVTWTYDETTQLQGTPLIQHGDTPLLSEEVQKRGKTRMVITEIIIANSSKI